MQPLFAQQPVRLFSLSTAMAPKRARRIRVPAIAGGAVWEPQTRRERATVANWAIKRMRWTRTAADGTVERGRDELHAEIVFPVYEHDAGDARFGSWSETQEVLFR